MGKTGGVASSERSGSSARKGTRVAVIERADVRPPEQRGSDPAEATFAAAAGAAIGAAADAERAADVAIEADSQASESAASAVISDAESVAADTAADVAHEASLVAHAAEMFATDVAARAATSLLSVDEGPFVGVTDPEPVDSATAVACAIAKVAIAVAETAAAVARTTVGTVTLVTSEVERDLGARARLPLSTGEAEQLWTEEPSLSWPKEGGYPPSTRAALEPFLDAVEEAHARAFMDEPTFAVLLDKAHEH